MSEKSHVTVNQERHGPAPVVRIERETRDAGDPPGWPAGLRTS